MSISKLMMSFTIFILIFLLSFGIGYSRKVRTYNSSGLISDDIIDPVIEQPTLLSLEQLTAPITCEPMYGFLPCTTTTWGPLFLILVYEYMLFLGENYISMGSELLFKVLGPGIFGASAFHILGSLPEAILVLASGLYGGKETAQDAVTTGICILAGSTVMLLTLLWGSCLAFGSLDLSAPPKSSPDHQIVHNKKPLSLTGYGVTTDVETSYTAVIMITSIIPFIIVHVAQFCGLSSWDHISILFSLIISLSFLFIFCFYQVFQPWIQNRRLEYMLDKYVEKTILRKLLGADGIPKVAIIKDLFHKIDQNNDKFVTLQELRGLILGIQFEEVGLKKDDYLEKVMKEFDTSGDVRIDEDEFVRGIYSWLSKTKQSVYKKDSKRRCQRNPTTNTTQTAKNTEEQELLVKKTTETIKVDHKDIHGVENEFGTFVKAASLLLLGTGILGLLAAPLIDAVQNFSTAANINPFFISFVILPVAINYREAVSAVASARQKQEHSASLTFSEIYSAVFMNNIVGISIFLGIIYAQGFTWNFSAEVLVVLIVCISMGLVGSYCRTLHIWASLIAYFLYFFSLFLLYIFINILGWA